MKKGRVVTTLLMSVFFCVGISAGLSEAGGVITNLNTGETYTCDGVSDQVQINGAIEDAVSGNILELDGTFVIDNTIILQNGISLVGSGISSATITCDPINFAYDGAAMFLVENTNDVVISDMTINGGEQSTSTQHSNGGHGWQNAIVLREIVTNCTIEDMYFTLIDGDAVRAVGDSAGITMKDCIVNCSGHDGAQVWGGQNWLIQNCSFNLMVNSGIRYANTVNSTISGCEFYCNTGSGFCGVELENTVHNINIRDNYFHDIENSYGIGIATVNAVGDINVFNNTFENCPGGAMQVSGITVTELDNTVNPASSVNSVNSTSAVSRATSCAATNYASIQWETLQTLVGVYANQSTENYRLAGELLNSSMRDITIAQQYVWTSGANDTVYFLLAESKVKEDCARKLFELSAGDLDAARALLNASMPARSTCTSTVNNSIKNETSSTVNIDNETDSDTEQSVNIPDNAKLAALQMTTTLENSDTKLQFNYAENINDGRGITFGCIGFCTGTYDGNQLIKHYTELNPNNTLVKYIPALDQIDAGPHNSAGGDGNDDVTGLDGFIQDVQACDDPLFKQAQLDMLNELYWNPAVDLASSVGAQYALTTAFIYDMSVRHGADGAGEIISAAGSISDYSSETEYLRALIELRDAELAKEGLGDVDRDTGYIAVLDSGNVNLSMPFTFTAYGDEFTIDGDMGV